MQKFIKQEYDLEENAKRIMEEKKKEVQKRTKGKNFKNILPKKK